MSFNRTKYDKCAYNLQMDRSTNPGDYRLYAPFAENCDQCYSYDGPIGSKSDVSTSKKQMDLKFTDMAQTESELSWRRQLLTKCNNDAGISQTTTNHKPNCTNKLTSEDTRFTHPIDQYRCMSLTSLMVEPYLSVNPQCNVQEISDRTGLNSRLHLKDTFKPVKQEFWDKGDALPKEIKNLE